MSSWCGPCRCDCDRGNPGSMSAPPSCAHSSGPISATSCERIMADGMMQVRVKRISFEAENINSYELVAVAGGDLAPFTAGSHIDLHLSNGMIRSYSLVNDQSERRRYVIAVNKDAASRGGSRFVHDNIRAGDLITISHPRNNFSLHEEAEHS